MGDMPCGWGRSSEEHRPLTWKIIKKLQKNQWKSMEISLGTPSVAPLVQRRFSADSGRAGVPSEPGDLLGTKWGHFIFGEIFVLRTEEADILCRFGLQTIPEFRFGLQITPRSRFGLKTVSGRNFGLQTTPENDWSPSTPGTDW